MKIRKYVFYIFATTSCMQTVQTTPSLKLVVFSDITEAIVLQV